MFGSFSCVSSKKHGISFNLSVSQSDCYHIAAAMLHRTNETAEATWERVAGLPKKNEKEQNVQTFQTSFH